MDFVEAWESSMGLTIKIALILGAIMVYAAYKLSR